jgi:hypothetical protein
MKFQTDFSQFFFKKNTKSQSPELCKLRKYHYIDHDAAPLRPFKLLPRPLLYLFTTTTLAGFDHTTHSTAAKDQAARARSVYP